MNEHLMKMADQEVEILHLCTGFRATGSPYYAYLLILPSKIKEFEEAHRTRNISLEEFGEVLASGEEFEPPENLRAEIEERLLKPSREYLAEHRAEMLQMLEIEEGSS